MRRLAAIAVFLSIFAFIPLTAQDDGPNVFNAIYMKARQGKLPVYNAAVREYLLPLNDELVRRGYLVSYETLVQNAGTGEFTNVHIYEFANWSAVADLTQSVRIAACRDVFDGKTCQEKLAEFGDMAELRTSVRREYYISLKP